MPVPRIDYVSLLLLILCISFFAKAAQLDHRPAWLWGALSLTTWIAFTQWVLGGIPGGLVSQVLLYAALTAINLSRVRKTP